VLQTRAVPDDKSPVDQVLDLLVFAPLGLALTAKTQMPEIVAKGRAQVEGQLTMARFIGQFAVQQGKVELEKRLKSSISPPPPPAAAPRAAPEAPAAEPPEPPGDRPVSVTVPVTVRAEPAPDPASAAGASPAPTDLAIPGYDALSASQVVQRLAGLSSAELEQVRLYEASTRGRKTVLTKISQLQ
jgi:hypothetical protein